MRGEARGEQTHLEIIFSALGRKTCDFLMHKPSSGFNASYSYVFAWSLYPHHHPPPPKHSEENRDQGRGDS